MKDIFEISKNKIQIDESLKNNDYAINQCSIEKYLFRQSYETPYLYDKPQSAVKYLFKDEDLDEISGPDFIYNINEHGFRSKTFENFDKEKTNVLFLGCSITQGVGLPEENTWYKKFIDNLYLTKKFKDIDYYNLSINGAGYELMFKNFLTFLDTVGKPDILIAYIPEIYRTLFYSGNKYQTLHLAVDNLDLDRNMDEVKKIRFKYINEYSMENELMKFSTLMHAIESLCNLSDIKFIWSTWAREQSQTLNKIKFKNYIIEDLEIGAYHISPENIYKKTHVNKKYPKDLNRLKYIYDLENVNDEPYWTAARDGWHPGSYAHTLIANFFTRCFLEKYP